MGWGETKRPDPTKRLADAVRDWDRARTTGSEERLRAALVAYDEANMARDIQAATIHLPEPETGRRTGW